MSAMNAMPRPSHAVVTFEVALPVAWQLNIFTWRYVGGTPLL